MLKQMVSFVAVAAAFTCTLWGEIRETNEIATVQDYVTEDSLVLMNLTGTLYAPATTLADNRWRLYFEERVKALIVNDEDFAQPFINATKNFIVNKIPKKAVEETTAQFVADLQNRKIPVLGLTRKSPSTAYARNFGDITHYHLLSVGIDLEKTLPYLAVQGQDDENQTLAHGLVFTKKKPAGTSLLAFLDRLETKPAKIIMIDDAEKNLKSVEEALEGRGIAFEGFRYSRTDENNAHFDPDLGTIEYFKFVFENQIMKDEEASELKSKPADISYADALDAFILWAWHTDIQNRTLRLLEKQL